MYDDACVTVRTCVLPALQIEFSVNYRTVKQGPQIGPGKLIAGKRMPPVKGIKLPLYLPSHVLTLTFKKGKGTED